MINSRVYIWVAIFFIPSYSSACSEQPGFDAKVILHRTEFFGSAEFLVENDSIFKPWDIFSIYSVINNIPAAESMYFCLEPFSIEGSFAARKFQPAVFYRSFRSSETAWPMKFSLTDSSVDRSREKFIFRQPSGIQIGLDLTTTKFSESVLDEMLARLGRNNIISLALPYAGLNRFDFLLSCNNVEYLYIFNSIVDADLLKWIFYLAKLKHVYFFNCTIRKNEALKFRAELPLQNDQGSMMVVNVHYTGLIGRLLYERAIAENVERMAFVALDTSSLLGLLGNDLKILGPLHSLPIVASVGRSPFIDNKGRLMSRKPVSVICPEDYLSGKMNLLDLRLQAEADKNGLLPKEFSLRRWEVQSSNVEFDWAVDTPMEEN